MRTLACIDPVPAADGSCVQTAWVEQATFVDYLPTVEQANEVGIAFFAGYLVVAFTKAIFSKSSEGND